MPSCSSKKKKRSHCHLEKGSFSHLRENWAACIGLSLLLIDVCVLGYSKNFAWTASMNIWQWWWLPREEWQLWDNFGTTLGQLWDDFGTSLSVFYCSYLVVTATRTMSKKTRAPAPPAPITCSRWNRLLFSPLLFYNHQFVCVLPGHTELSDLN